MENMFFFLSLSDRQLEPQIYGMMAYVILTDIDYPVLGSLVYLLAPKDFYIIFWLSNLLTMR